jgi:hypothetical protein
VHPLPGSQVGRIRGVIAPRRLVPSEFVLNRPRPDGRPGAYLPAQPMKACGLVFGGVLRHLVRVLRPKFSQLVAKVEGLPPGSGRPVPRQVRSHSGASRAAAAPTPR